MNLSRAWLGIAVLAMSTGSLTAQQTGVTELEAASFAKLHQMIRPQPGELRFHEIPWLLSIWDARIQAAAEGKPILVWSGSGGAPVGSC